MKLINKFKPKKKYKRGKVNEWRKGYKRGEKIRGDEKMGWKRGKKNEKSVLSVCKVVVNDFQVSSGGVAIVLLPFFTSLALA